MQVLYIVLNLRTRPTHLTTYWFNIRGLLSPTLIDRINKLMTNNIRLTYKCHTLLETSGQGLPIYQHIRLILGGYLTPHTYRVNKLMTNNLL